MLNTDGCGLQQNSWGPFVYHEENEMSKTTTKRNLAGSAYCIDCGARAEYGSGGTLGIRHAADCPNRHPQ